MFGCAYGTLLGHVCANHMSADVQREIRIQDSAQRAHPLPPSVFTILVEAHFDRAIIEFCRHETRMFVDQRRTTLQCPTCRKDLSPLFHARLAAAPPPVVMVDAGGTENSDMAMDTDVAYA